jgi:hypothetical protein
MESSLESSYPSVNTGREFQVLVVTDGRPRQINGLGILLRSWSKVIGRKQADQIRILCPSAAVAKEVRHQLDLGLSQVIPCHAPIVSDDPYVIKLMLGEYVRQAANPEAVILYIDYDHLVRFPPRFPVPHEGEVFVSSEVSRNEWMHGLSTPSIPTQGLHLNTSLLIGLASDLRDIAGCWADTYVEIGPCVPIRWQEEVSFSVAAQKLGIVLKPVDRSLQGHWNDWQEDSCLFHYGGIHESAARAKSFLDASRPVLKSMQSRALSHPFLREFIDYLLLDSCVQ